MKLSCFVVFILLGSTVFSLSFQGVDGPLWVEHLLTGLPGGQLGFLIVVNLLIFVLAFFLDFFELPSSSCRCSAPVADKLGIDLVWFGVLLAVNMQTSFMHPPFGFALFYLRSVAPDRATTTTASPAGASRKVTTGADLLGRGAVRGHPDRDGRPDHRLPGAGRRRHRQGRADRRRQGVRARCSARRGRASRRRREPAPAAPSSRCAARCRRASSRPRPTRCAQRSNRCSATQGTQPTRGTAARRKKKPRARGLSSAAERAAQSFCACMKSSKPASVKRNHRFCVAAEFGVVVVDLLPLRVAVAQLAVERHRRP